MKNKSTNFLELMSTSLEKTHGRVGIHLANELIQFSLDLVKLIAEYALEYCFLDKFTIPVKPKKNPTPVKILIRDNGEIIIAYTSEIFILNSHRQLLCHKEITKQAFDLAYPTYREDSRRVMIFNIALDTNKPHSVFIHLYRPRDDDVGNHFIVELYTHSIHNPLLPKYETHFYLRNLYFCGNAQWVTSEGQHEIDIYHDSNNRLEHLCELLQDNPYISIIHKGLFYVLEHHNNILTDDFKVYMKAYHPKTDSIELKQTTCLESLHNLPDIMAMGSCNRLALVYNCFNHFITCSIVLFHPNGDSMGELELGYGNVYDVCFDSRGDLYVLSQDKIQVYGI